MASVRFDNLDDPRYLVLGRLLGMDEFAAVGRIAKVYQYCTDRQSYTIPKLILQTITRVENFDELMVQADLAEIIDGEIRVKGTRGRIEWLQKLRKNSKLGGKKTKANWQAKRGPDGSQVAVPDEGPLTLTTTLTKALTKSYINTEQKIEKIIPAFNFEKAFEKYPPGGGATPLEECKTEIVTSELYHKLLHAVDAYAAEWKAKGGDLKFTKARKNFMKEWRGWADKPLTTPVATSSGVPSAEATRKQLKEIDSIPAAKEIPAQSRAEFNKLIGRIGK